MKQRTFEIDLEKLYEVAKKNNEQRLIEDDLYSFKKILDGNYGAKLLFEDISIDRENRKKFVGEIFKPKSKMFISFIDLLIENEEMDIFSSVSEKYTRFLAEKEDLDLAELILSENAAPAILGQIEKFVANKETGKRLDFKVRIDPSILGGYIVKKIDGTVIDASLKGRLDQLKRGIQK
ncbi:ATP synthase F1 subunit delta [Candidatus Saganbacteria bacterium]|nr:ATP synthase F1 subunit delta [Candidatus Saganbacteria bacterium]